MSEERFSFYLLLGQSAQKTVRNVAGAAPVDHLWISDKIDLSQLLPKEVVGAADTAEIFKLFYVFENYLRDLILDVMSEKFGAEWWTRVPKNVQEKIKEREEMDERKAWMALESRSKLELATLPELISIMDDKDNWKDTFEPNLRDRALINEARTICHTRNTVCHMCSVTIEEAERVRQVIRDWFRALSP